MLNIKGLYYITHIDNLPSIFVNGILSHERIVTENINYTSIYDLDLVNDRKERYTSDEKNLWHYTNLFLQPRNPMLYRILKSIGKQNISVLGISKSIMEDRQGIFITDGIASSSHTRIYPQSEGMKKIDAQRDILQSSSWISWDHSRKFRRQLMAECLVPSNVEPKYIKRFIVADNSVENLLSVRLTPLDLSKRVVATEEDNDIFTPSFQKQ